MAQDRVKWNCGNELLVQVTMVIINYSEMTLYNSDYHLEQG